jgi:predicted ATPase/transcriptional regulator with XRE-family HTH domain
MLVAVRAMMQRSGAAFGELLKRSRLATGLTQEGLAEAAAISREAISALERGGRKFPRADTVELLANALSLVGDERAALRAAAARPSVPRNAEREMVVAPRAPTSGGSPSLPIALTPLIGRMPELAHASTRLVRDKVRLLTITGPAGVGKSRLALELAWTCREAFADGAVFLDVASVQSHEQLSAAAARFFGLPRPPGSYPCESVVAHLRDKHMLVVLDNFEQLLSAASILVEVLAECPSIAVVVTSRGILHVRGEELLAISPMFVPQSTTWASLQDLARTPAVALFLARAQAVRPDFQLTEANAGDVVAICRHLDGLPLALELAALRVRLLPPRALLRRLERRLPTLTDGARDVPERHRTLRGALAWSYELLAPRDQALFRCLSLFENGATLSDITAVWRLSYAIEAQPDDDVEILEGLAALADQGLIRQEGLEGAEPRFAMLETIREYGLELLIAANELDTTVRACTNYYLPRLEAGELEAWWPTPTAARLAHSPAECLSTPEVFAQIG